MLNKQDCSDFEMRLVAILKEATDTELRNDRVKTCYLGLRAAINDLYSDPDQYARVLACYVQLRSALDEQQLADKLEKAFRHLDRWEQHHRVGN